MTSRQLPSLNSYGRYDRGGDGRERTVGTVTGGDENGRAALFGFGSGVIEVVLAVEELDVRGPESGGAGQEGGHNGEDVGRVSPVGEIGGAGDGHQVQRLSRKTSLCAIHIRRHLRGFAADDGRVWAAYVVTIGKLNGQRIGVPVHAPDGLDGLVNGRTRLCGERKRQGRAPRSFCMIVERAYDSAALDGSRGKYVDAALNAP